MTSPGRRRWRPRAAGIAAAVLAASLLPLGSGGEAAGGPAALGAAVLGVRLDLWLHAAAFAALAALFEPAGDALDARLGRRLLWSLGVVVAAALFGGAIELLQAPLPWRSASPLDLLADAGGALAGVAASAAWRRHSAG